METGSFLDFLAGPMGLEPTPSGVTVDNGIFRYNKFIYLLKISCSYFAAKCNLYATYLPYFAEV